MSMQKYSFILIRLSIVCLFLWFGMQQLMNPSAWVSYLPEWTGYLPIPGEILVGLNGWFEVLSALLLAVGCYTRFLALILSVHLAGIAWTAGGAVGIRDAALALCTLALFMAEPDHWTLDHKSSKAGIKSGYDLS